MYIIWGRGLSEKTENRQDNSTTEKPAGKFDDGASARQPVRAKRGRDMRATLLATGETEFWGYEAQCRWTENSRHFDRELTSS